MQEVRCQCSHTELHVARRGSSGPVHKILLHSRVAEHSQPFSPLLLPVPLIGNADVQRALKQKVLGTQCLHSKSGEETHFWSRLDDFMLPYKGSAKESSYCWSVPLGYETSHRNVQPTLTFLKMNTSYILIPSRTIYLVIYDY